VVDRNVVDRLYDLVPEQSFGRNFPPRVGTQRRLHQFPNRVAGTYSSRTSERTPKDVEFAS